MIAHVDNRPMLRQGLSVLILLCIIRLSSASSHETCPCSMDHVTHQGGMSTIDMGVPGKDITIQCCVSEILGFVDPEATIEWAYEDQPIALNERANVYCNNETVFITNVQSTDEGNYSCTVSSSNGTVGHHATYLYTCEQNSGFNENPKNVNIGMRSLVSSLSSEGAAEKSEQREGTKDTKDGLKKLCAEEGSAIELTCEAVVGHPGTCDELMEDLKWLFQRPGAEDTLLSATPAYPKVDSRGVLQSSVTIKSVTKEHFGKYTCGVSNANGFSWTTIHLIEGDSLMMI